MEDKKAIVQFEQIWMQGTEVVECTGCRDKTYGGSYRLCIHFLPNDKVEKTDVVVCNSCYDLLKDTNVQE